MASVDPAGWKEPLAGENPCGPDLEALGDVEYLNVMARVEGVLPDSFFAFDRKGFDISADAEALAGLLGRSRDLRPLLLLAKLSILDRNLVRFADCLEAAEGLLATHWANVHPGIANGGGPLRLAVLQTLDDLPTVVLPLQHAPLMETRRAGTITFRDQLTASGEVPRRAGEDGPDLAAIEQACADVETGGLIATRDALARIQRAIKGLRLVSLQNAGPEGAPALDRLARLADRMLAFVENIVARRAPGDALAVDVAPDGGDVSAPDDAASAPLAGAVATSAQAAAALAAVGQYLADREPSSPSLLLVRQARQLIGRSFVEIMQLLVPEAAKEARIQVGAEPTISFKLDQFGPADPPRPDAGASAQDAPAERPAVRSRREAQALLDEVAAFYRGAEPSNPIPLLCERARAMTALDFATLLKDIMPKKK